MPSFGVLRLGTGNALASALDASRSNLDGLAADLARARRQDSDSDLNLLRLEGRMSPFAGIGLDSLILSDYNSVKRSFAKIPLGGLIQGGAGYAAAIATRSLWRMLLEEKPEVTIRNDGAPAQRIDIAGRPVGRPIPRGGILYRGPVTIAAASTIPFYGLGLRLFPQADQRVDRFQLRVSNIDPLTVLPRLPALFKGTFDSPEIHDFFCTAVTVQTSRPHPLQIGGDEVGDRSTVHIGMTCVRVVQGQSEAEFEEQALGIIRSVA
jgi:hypothetical protein